MDETESEFKKLLMLANEKSLVQEKSFILCLADQPETSDSPPPAAVFV